ncbi:MAG: oligosaccharide flippase family protein [Candidatus Electryonea clarkiae]|nr:oligosaccharide flippase family protein [Candidatus Electryonea clarkiae]MDP8289061.1 oligosaccharide flippase family protein [Candidatus Electryonea clarkiae]
MVRGTALTAVHRAIEAALALFVVPFTLHRLGTDAYGLWALFYAITVYLNLADLGFAASLNRHFVAALSSGDEDEKLSVFSTGLTIMATVASLVLILGVLFEKLFIGFFPGAGQFGLTAYWVWRALIVVLSLGFLTNYGRSLFFSTHRTGSLALLNIFLAIANAGSIVIALSSGWGLNGLAGAVVVISLLRLTFTFWLGAKGTPGWKIRVQSINKATFIKMWSFGIKVQLARIADIINQQFDRVLLGRVAGLENVTYYDVGAKAASTANLLPTTAYYVIEPAAATFSSQGDSEKFTSLLLKSGKYMAIAALSVGIFIIVAAHPLLTLWLGSFPQPLMTLALRFLIIAYMVWTLVVPLRLCSRGAGHPSWEATSASVQAVANIVLSIVLYNLFGFIGVLYGTFSAAVIGQSMMTVKALTGLKQPAWRFIRVAWLGPVSASLIAGIISWIILYRLVGLPGIEGRIETLPCLIISGIGYVLVFAAILIVFGILRISELKTILGYFKK